MERRISFITLAVRDLSRSHEFYIGGLGWQAELHVPGEVLMIRTGARLVLSLWVSTEFEAEVGPIARGDGVPPITLAHNVASPEAVDEVLALAQRCGARVDPARQREWGGYSGYFADPDGYRWEIAMNPDPIGQSLLPEGPGSAGGPAEL
ncbi:VOC family protein [Leucobacter celer]|uniref:VOC family protein n=1 Tax=Leucobacter celer TaxID=668625 RepID=UPI0006A7CCC9|nr:VOC family protein [Leucobacter celer]